LGTAGGGGAVNAGHYRRAVIEAVIARLLPITELAQRLRSDESS
jgi:hypothetical protein